MAYVQLFFYVKHSLILDTESCTSDSREHKLIQCAGPKRDSVLHSNATASGSEVANVFRFL